MYLLKEGENLQQVTVLKEDGGEETAVVIDSSLLNDQIPHKQPGV